MNDERRTVWPALRLSFIAHRLSPLLKIWQSREAAFDAGRDLLYPPLCVSCGVDTPDRRDRIALCAPCREGLVPASVHLCRRCGLQVPEHEAEAADCSFCRGRRFRFDSVTALAAYDDEMRSAVLRMKHPAEEPLSAALGKLLAVARRTHLAPLRPDLVIPVPMHWMRRMARGTNSPQLLAEQIATLLKVPHDPRVLLQQRRTPSQGNLSRAERIRNVRQAFKVSSRYDLAGARLLLVDDVLTTGATCNEVAKVLKAAGAVRVDVAVLARAQLTK